MPLILHPGRGCHRCSMDLVHHHGMVTGGQRGGGGEGLPGRAGHGLSTSASATGLGIFEPALGICKLKAYY